MNTINFITSAFQAQLLNSMGVIIHDNNSDKSNDKNTLNLMLKYGLVPTEVTSLPAFEVMDEIIASNEKEGFIVRSKFIDDPYADLSDEDLEIIYAQYAQTYGWKDLFYDIFQEDTSSVLARAYRDHKQIDITDYEQKLKPVHMITQEELQDKLQAILLSSSILSKQIKEIFFGMPSDLAINFFNGAQRLPVSENAIFLTYLNYYYTNKLDLKLIKNLPALKQIITFLFAKNKDDVNILAQEKITKDDFKKIKLRIPTSARKIIILHIDKLSQRPDKAAESVIDDIMYWKNLVRHLRWEKKSKTEKKFPSYIKFIELLYKKDRSWTFNSRYQKAIFDRDLNQAAYIAAEEPGFLFRNILTLLRENDT